jgi:hypothetical protein
MEGHLFSHLTGHGKLRALGIASKGSSTGVDGSGNGMTFSRQYWKND